MSFHCSPPPRHSAVSHQPCRRFLLAALPLALVLASCATKTHETLAILLRESAPNTFVGNTLKTTTDSGTTGLLDTNPIPFSTNAIFVPENSLSAFKIEAINPGWIHQGIGNHVPTQQKDRTAPDSSISVPDFEQITKGTEIERYISNKELWLVINIVSVDPSDPLGLNAKKTFHASAIRYDNRSFGLIPLDDRESASFSLRDNIIQNVDIKIYEVQAVEFKRALAVAYKNSPGIVGLAKDAWNSVLGTAGAAVGDAVVKTLKQEYGEDLMLERLLLATDGVIQFHARFTVLRDNTLPKLTGGTGDPNQSRFLFLDRLKEESFNPATESRSFTAVNKQSNYATVATNLNKGLNLNELKSYTPFLLLSVNTLADPVAEAQVDAQQNQEQAEILTLGALTRATEELEAIKNRAVSQDKLEYQLAEAKVTAAKLRKEAVEAKGKADKAARNAEKMTLEAVAAAATKELEASTLPGVISAIQAEINAKGFQTLDQLAQGKLIEKRTAAQAQLQQVKTAKIAADEAVAKAARLTPAAIQKERLKILKTPLN